MESNVQSKIMEYLKSEGAYVVKVHQASRNGVPDIFACWKGLFIGIEVKDNKESLKPEPLQEWNLKQIRKSGGIAFSAKSVKEVKETFSQIKKS
jgi:Holliday junction resolvase